MDNDFLENTKKKIQETWRFDEWEIVAEAINVHPENADALLKWVFEEYRGYVAPRVKAGIELMQRNEISSWGMLEYLISSDDPDDRDTGLTMLTKLQDQRAKELAKPILNDFWPYLRLDAAEYLMDDYPEDVVDCLQNILKMENDSYQEAVGILNN